MSYQSLRHVSLSIAMSVCQLSSQVCRFSCQSVNYVSPSIVMSVCQLSSQSVNYHVSLSIIKSVCQLCQSVEYHVSLSIIKSVCNLSCQSVNCPVSLSVVSVCQLSCKSVNCHVSRSNSPSVTYALLDICVWRGLFRGGWGEDGGWMPLPKRPRRYCDPCLFVWSIISTAVTDASDPVRT